VDQRLPCLICPKSYLNGDALVAHCKRDHSSTFATSGAVYGNVCPACGKPFERLAQHCSRAHHRQIALLFADVRGVGDPHGVVVTRMRYLLGQVRSEIEQAILAL
jgi:predicted amidophosphoribosyltransferase